MSTQRAYERYGNALWTSAIARLLSLACAGILPFFTHPWSAFWKRPPSSRR